MKADRGWKTPFDDPIDLPRGRQLLTLKDAADYIMKLPKAEQALKEGNALGKAEAEAGPVKPGCAAIPPQDRDWAERDEMTLILFALATKS